MGQILSGSCRRRDPPRRESPISPKSKNGRSKILPTNGAPRWRHTDNGLSLTRLVSENTTTEPTIRAYDDALAASLSGNFARALEGFEAVKRDAISVGDRELEGAALFRIGQQWENRRDHRRAAEAFDAALAIALEVGSKHLEMQALRGCSSIKKREFDFGGAENCLRKSLALALELDDVQSANVARQNLSVFFTTLGRAQAAQELIEGIADDAWTLLSKAKNKYLAGEVEGAIELWNETVRAATEGGSKKYAPLTKALASLNNVHTDRGELEAARRHRAKLFEVVGEKNGCGEPETECSICLDEMRSTDAIEVVPQCSHSYHRDCIRSARTATLKAGGRVVACSRCRE